MAKTEAIIEQNNGNKRYEGANGVIVIVDPDGNYDVPQGIKQCNCCCGKGYMEWCNVMQNKPRDCLSYPKPLLILWSSLASDIAGQNLPVLHARFLESILQFLPEARSAFLHVQPSAEPGSPYLLTGEELPDVCDVTCRLAKLRPMYPLPDDHEDPRMRGKVLNFPELIDNPANTRFVEVEG